MLTTLTPSPASSTSIRLLARHAEIAAAGPIRQPLLMPWIDGPLIGIHKDRVWLVAPAPQDPARTSDGRHVVPSRPLSELRQVAASGIWFHHIAVAHELDRQGPVGDLVPRLTDGPRPCTYQVARLLVGPIPRHPGVARLAEVLDHAAARFVRVAEAAWTDRAANRESAPRDPIIFGIVGGSGPPVVGEPALWYPLTAWEW
jgi:hypothetical protein